MHGNNNTHWPEAGSTSSWDMLLSSWAIGDPCDAKFSATHRGCGEFSRVWLCRCQTKCHDACAKASSMAQGPANTIAATSSALLALDQAWEDYLNKIRRENNMACH